MHPDVISPLGRGCQLPEIGCGGTGCLECRHAISVNAKSAARAAPVTTSTVHTGAGGMSRPAAQRANGSRHRAPATIEALINDRSADEPPPIPFSSNGHGSLEAAVSVAEA